VPTYNLAVNSSQPADPSSPALESARILALDVGSKTLGLAVSDPLGITAQGLETIRRSNKRQDFEQLRRVIRRYGVSEIVVGNPLRLSGEAGVQSERMAELAEQLRKKFALPVHLWDERLTSAEANRVLRESGVSIQKRADAIDRLAAVLILQAFLEFRRSSAG
jgi:putative holliday junction resolvase